ncbi:isoprenyl transferase [Paenibacillus agricola]|uniref:Isoprenyl transferase n=1 Tax=Paenibacillus agricola TaxID=2716264 RepID=A0ABX0J0P7_9BACL|nr:isoprenyl transferase [Paenibacillus agricola]NHN28348.1 isoprenyl transferase [Paenibacillus agricola]
MIPFKKWFGSKPLTTEHLERLDADNIPNHVAVIMDGNGRWAQKRGLPRVAGHHSGMKNVKKITMAANAIGVNVLTLYAFSTENWKRPKEEVDYLMKLPLEFFPKEIEELIANNVQIRMTGWQEGLPDYTLKSVQDAIEQTKHNTGLILNFALNYGSRKEMLSGVKQIAEDVQAGKIKIDEINESVFSNYLLTYPLPDPDLLIRTSGELRISNFMMWQLAYSELWFTDLCWPEFTEQDFYEAVQEYQRRARRYGGL